MFFQKAQKKDKSVVREYVEAILIALVLALFIRSFIVQAFKIPSGSMEPTLLIGDHLLVNKFLYGVKNPFTGATWIPYKNPERSDVIVFKYPEDPRRDFIKRVIAVGGQTVEGRDRIIYVNGKPFPEPYVKHTEDRILPADVTLRDNFGPILVPKGKLFVMGDNRENSHDSRFWGFVGLEAVLGKAIVIYWSQDGSILHPRWQRFGKLIR